MQRILRPFRPNTPKYCLTFAPGFPGRDFFAHQISCRPTFIRYYRGLQKIEKQQLLSSAKNQAIRFLGYLAMAPWFGGLDLNSLTRALRRFVVGNGRFAKRLPIIGVRPPNPVVS